MDHLLAPRSRRARLGVRSLAVAAALTVGVGALAAPADAQGTSSPPLPPNAVEIALATPELSTLVQAVTKAGLAGTLAADGDLTIFAPTNDAFAALLP